MAPPARPVWTGQIRLALVALPVKLYSALDSKEKISFNQIHEPSKQRIRYEKVAPGIGAVDKDEIVKGYEYQKGRYVLFSDEEFEALKVDSKKTLDMIQFAPAETIDPIYFDKPYYALPDGKLADEPYRVVCEALKRTKTVGLGQITMRGRSYVAAVKPYEDGLIVETVHYAEELRSAKAFFDEIPSGKLDADLISLAEELITRKKAKFDPSKFEDEYAIAIERLVKKKIERHGELVLEDQEMPAADYGDNVVSLVDALKKSLQKKSPKASDDEDEAKPAPKRRAAAERTKAPRAKAPAKSAAKRAKK
ncbi:non-homologous end joining protein Ku [Terricaulis silvestris]|uniref:non-homologous end joining protein Ku n=1 Tax=Terricaulis silvestris TaxID=2686094 RepID=UPI00131D22D0|nr:Ku protein [Terricaulis silvestris]